MFFLVKESTQVLVNCLRTKPVKEKCGEVNWPARGDPNCDEWAIKLHFKTQTE